MLQAPDVLGRMAQEGAEPAGGTPAEFAAHIKAERARMGKVIGASGEKFD